MNLKAVESNIGTSTSTVAISKQVQKFKKRVIIRESKDSREEKSVPEAARVESLVSLSLKVIANNFEENPVSTGVPKKYLAELTSRLPLDLDINVASAYVYDENYWKARSEAKPWKNCQISNHGMTWKQLFFERSLEEVLESYDKDNDDFQNVADYIKASQDYIFRLEIKQLLSHLDLNVLFDNLPNLSSLFLTYGVRQVGMSYDRSLFGMKIADATTLASGVRNTSALTSLNLPCNLIDDDLMRMLMTGLISNTTLTELDVSHNKITNTGARLLSKILGPKSILTSLDVCDNQIHAEGGRYFGRALKRNRSLTELNLRLNRLTDEGGRLILQGLGYNTTLQKLNLSSNSLATESCGNFCNAIMKESSALASVDMSGNEFNEEDMEAIKNALEDNRTLVSLDLRRNHVTAESSAVESIQNIIKANELESRKTF